MDAAEGPLSANSLIDHLMMEQLTSLAVARLTNVFQLILRSPLVQSWPAAAFFALEFCSLAIRSRSAALASRLHCAV